MSIKQKTKRQLAQKKVGRSPFDRELVRESKRDAVPSVAASAFNQQGHSASNSVQ
ncbi:hypothetical protein [Marinobacter psychrophilus]|nr:hypothetical protein [Marinobacter psychrophilus]